MKEYIKPRIITMAIAPVTMMASSVTSVSGIDNPIEYGGENDGTHSIGSAKYNNIWEEECGDE